MLALLPYDRAAAVRYAHLWAYGRNPRYYDYEGIGGDCTNFASQCIYAGAGVMNDTPTFGWYYINANDKAPAWTGVEYLYNFLTRRTPSAGPFAGEVSPERIRPGDIVQTVHAAIRTSSSPRTASTPMTARCPPTNLSVRASCTSAAYTGRDD